MKCIWCSSRTSRPHPATMSSLGEAIIHLAIDLFHQIRQSKKENIFLSPFSISSALAMTYLGARENTASEMEKVGGSCLSVTGLHGLSAGWRAGDHRSACPRSHGKLKQPHDLVGTEGGTHSPAGLPPAPVPGLPLGAGMTPYNCRGEALMEEFTGSEALTKIHGRHLYTFPQRWNKNLTWFFKVDSNQAALCFPHTDCVF